MIILKIDGSRGTVPHFKMRHTRQNSNRRISTALVAGIFTAMKNKIFPEGITDEEFKKYLFSVAHTLRYQAKDVQAGRPPKYQREMLNSQITILDELLDQETAGWLKLPFFITNCVPVLWYPHDVKHALDADKINLEEARILSLINRKNLGEKTKGDLSHIRRDLLESHLRRAGTQKELRQRVNAKLGKTSKAEAETVSRIVTSLNAEADELLNLNEGDTDHLLWEEIKNLVFLARDIDVSRIEEGAFSELLDELDKIQFKLSKYKPRVSELVEQI